MKQSKVEELLIINGKKQFRRPRERVHFTRINEADDLLNNIEEYPHGFVFGCIMDRQVKAEIAWSIPYKIYKKRLGDFTFKSFSELSRGEIKELMIKPQPLHRFPKIMADFFYNAIQIITHDYNGDTSKIWSGDLSSAEVVYRFLQFQGVGPKIATMAANILVRDFKIKLKDYYSIDISPDVHIKRVFKRLKLIHDEATIEELVYKARSIHPEYPGILDYSTWEIGRNWCKPNKPLCSECYLSEFCPSSNIKNS